jgi:DNA (cytosine-5)-methyltransferase 1
MRRLKAADLFCGAGGSTTGAVQAGVDVVLAVNHWRTAVLSHQANHPATRHICARIDDVDPRNDRTLPELDLLLASPECVYHSIARGGRPIDDQKRATPWHVCVWAEAKRPEWIIVENVREFRDWGPLDERNRPDKSRRGQTFRAWIRAIESLGYQVDHQLLNAADFGAATKRIRLFIVARRLDSRRGRREIPWPEPTHAPADWRPAAEVIDWGRPCPSIFARKRALAPKTLARIEAGLRKFVGEAAGPFIVVMRNHQDAAGAGQPLSTICTSGAHHGLAVPFLVPNFGERSGQSPRVHSVDAPAPTVTSHGAGGLAVPFILPRTGVYDSRDHLKRCRGVDEPLPTIIAGNATGHLVLPFLTKYYGTGTARPVSEPLDVVTTRDRFGLAMVSLVRTMRELGVVDIGFRMLDVDELARAQGFPDGYELVGTKAERVKQVGNAVCPPVMRALCETVTNAA